MLDHLSYSSRRSLKTCPRKFWLQKHKGLESKTKSLGLLQGSYFSDKLEQHYDIQGSRLEASELEKTIEAATSKSAYDTLIIGKGIADMMFDRYIERYEEPGELHREIELCTPIPTSELTDDGYVDGLSVDGSYFVEDKLLNGRYWTAANEEALALNAQVSGYFYGLHEAGYDVRECRYRVQLKPSIYKRTGEDATEYLKRVEEKIDEKPDNYFREYILTRDEESLDDYVRDMVFYTGLYERMNRDGFFPKNDNACADYGGCEFLPLCTGKVNAMENLQIRKKDGR